MIKRSRCPYQATKNIKRGLSSIFNPLPSNRIGLIPTRSLKLGLKLNSYFVGLPYAWVDEWIQFNPKGLPTAKICSLIQWIYLAFQGYIISLPSHPAADRVLGVFLFALYLAVAWVRLAIFPQGLRLDDFLNKLAEYEREKYSNSHPELVERCILGVHHLGQVSFPLVGIFVGLMALGFPCLPPFLTSLIFQSKCQMEDGYLGIGIYTRITFALFEWYYISSALLCSAFLCEYLCLGGLVSMWKYAKDLPPIRDSKGVRSYRHLQVLSSVVTDAIRRLIFPGMVTGAVGIQIIGAVLSIRMQNEGQLWLQGLFLLTSFDAFGGSLLTMIPAGMVYFYSIAILKDMKWNGGVRTGIHLKEWMRLWKSLTPLKLYFGQCFVNPCTPLVVQSFSAAQTANLLLCTR